MDCTVSHENCPKWKILIMMFFVITFLICIPMRVFADIEYFDFDDLGGDIVGSLALASGGNYGYYSNGAYNTVVTQLNQPTVNLYNQSTGRMFATYWEQQGQQTFPSYESYYDFMAYQTSQVSASMGGRYTRYDSDSDTVNVRINAEIAKMMLDFMGWQQSLLGASTNTSTDYATNTLVSENKVTIGGYEIYELNSHFNLASAKNYEEDTIYGYSSHSIDNNSYPVYICRSSTGRICFVSKGNFMIDNLGWSWGGSTTANDGSVIYYSNATGDTSTYIATGTMINGDNGLVPIPLVDMDLSSIWADTEDTLSDTDIEIQFTPQEGVEELDFGNIQTYIDRVEADPEYEGVLEIPIPDASTYLGQDVANMTDGEIANGIAFQSYLNNPPEPLQVNDPAENDPSDPEGGDPETSEPQQVDPIPHMFGLPPIVFPNITGIWHYVVQWVASIRAWMSTMFTIWNILPDAMVYPVWASAVVVIVLGIYKRFFM